jgi:hypothetical protein
MAQSAGVAKRRGQRVDRQRRLAAFGIVFLHGGPTQLAVADVGRNGFGVQLLYHHRFLPPSNGGGDDGR